MGSSLILLIIVGCACIPSVNSDSLMNGTQTGKTMVFLWGTLLIAVLGLFRFWSERKRKHYKPSAIDLLLLTFCLYILFRNSITILIHSVLFLELGGLIIWYIIIRKQSDQALRWILTGVCIGGCIQAIYGNLQLWGYFPSHHGMFKMTGSFFNPGPYSGYLAAVFPVALGLYLFNIPIKFIQSGSFFSKLQLHFNSIASFLTKKLSRILFFYNNNKKRSSSRKLKCRAGLTDYITMKSFLGISIISMCLVLPASRSRAAWLAVLVSSCYLLAVKYQFYKKTKAFFTSGKKIVSLLIAVSILPSVIGFGLYHFKKDSADGRLLIWKVSAEMIKDKPLFGYGYDGFKKYYMDYQARYFKDKPDSQETMLAGDTNYAFNELIQLTVENGIVGLLLIVFLIVCIFLDRSPAEYFKPFKHNTSTSQTIETNDDLIIIARAIILSILTFGFFSYPLQIVPIKICLAIALAIIAGKWSQKGEVCIQIHPQYINKTVLFAGKTVVTISCLAALGFAAQHFRHIQTAYSHWKNAFDLYNIGVYHDCLDDYQKAYPVLKTNGDFLTNYGKALSMAEKHDKAIEVLQQAAGHYPNTVVFTALGDSYKKLGKTSNAEQSYLHAWHMNPSRFYPKYLLAKLYDETGQKTKALKIAQELLNKDVKIESTAVKEIQEEMKMIIKKNKTEPSEKSKI